MSPFLFMEAIMKIVTPAEMAQMDANCMAEGITALELMEEAGNACTEEILKISTDLKKVVIVCGTGNNGGDGQVIARKLTQKDYQVQVFFTGDIEKMSQESKANYALLVEQKIKITVLTQNNIKTLEEALIRTDLIIDAIFGTGLKNTMLSPFYQKIIKLMNAHQKIQKLIAIDIPSGMRGDNGKILGEAIAADETIVIQNYKTGFFLNEGPDCQGKTTVVDIGISEVSIVNEKRLIERAVLDFPTHRKKNTHKYNWGSILSIAGSKGMLGAGTLCAEAALKIGAGLVSSYIPADVYPILAGKARAELMVFPYHNNGNADEMRKKKYDVILMGPGIGRRYNFSIVLQAFLNDEKPLVIDADGLYHLKNILPILKNSLTDVVLTPHAAEFCHLADLEMDEFLEDPLYYGKKFVDDYKVTLVLKGTKTHIFTKGGEIWTNPTGNPGMATAGSGDVLAGFIAGLIPQCGYDVEEAAKTAVYYHGLAGDYYAQKYCEQTLCAGDIIKMLPYVLHDNM